MQPPAPLHDARTAPVVVRNAVFGGGQQFRSDPANAIRVESELQQVAGRCGPETLDAFTRFDDDRGIAVAPDADAMVAETGSFRIVDCPACGGMLKPDIVYFGEAVAKEVVAQAYSLMDSSDVLLVAGSSLTVFSGYRFVRHAAATGMSVAIVNRGPTRGDDLAAVKVDAGCSPILTLLADELSGSLPSLP